MRQQTVVLMIQIYCKWPVEGFFSVGLCDDLFASSQKQHTHIKSFQTWRLSKAGALPPDSESRAAVTHEWRLREAGGTFLPLTAPGGELPPLRHRFLTETTQHLSSGGRFHLHAYKPHRERLFFTAKVSNLRQCQCTGGLHVLIIGAVIHTLKKQNRFLFSVHPLGLGFSSFLKTALKGRPHQNLAYNYTDNCNFLFSSNLHLNPDGLWLAVSVSVV